MKTKLHDTHYNWLEYYNIIYYTLYCTFICTYTNTLRMHFMVKKIKKNFLLERENTCQRKEPLYWSHTWQIKLIVSLILKDFKMTNIKKNRQHGV